MIRNAVDSTRFHPGLRAEFRDGMRQQLKIPREANVVAYVGSGFERKGVAALLKALALAPGKPWAVIAGKDKHSTRYQVLAQRLGVSSRVRFVGAVSDVRPYYGAADSFALPTLYDPFPNAALWDAEVTKMIKAFGAPISDDDAKVIADYLKKNYGS